MEASREQVLNDEAVDRSRSLSRLVALAEQLQVTFVRRRLTLAVAESCTGGLVGHLLTEVPGSSAYFVGGAISYGDAVKTSLLDVSRTTLERHGAVSAQVAVAMAEGARN
ncbi:MAG: nicotinamide-nucleotide amidohydrolase family protein, partial [Chloroflexota bacterium]|nr:nicotinamide-nucleotide amidohydrolase family protein [Chloroflexota bacterium]